MHGTPKELNNSTSFIFGYFILVKCIYQAQAMLDLYNKLMYHEMQLMQARGLNTAVFGDIFLEDLKLYREEQLAKLGK
jgi:hypothetical protein